MPLTKAQKQDQVAAIDAKLEDHHTLYLTDYAGLSVEEVTNLRRAFRDAGVEYKVFKNTLVRRAMQGREGYDELYEELSGPTAIAFTNDPAAPARVIKKFLDSIDKELPRFKGAFIDGSIYGADALETLTKLKSRDELLGDILGLLLAPMTNVASALGAPATQLAGAIKEIAERADA